jgi:hypothetical protein
MATTTNYSWTTPDNTAYVKDGASAIRTLGSSVDTTLYTALGGAYPGLRLIKKQTIGSAVSSVAVTGAFSATYDNYKIMIGNSVGSTNANLQLTLTGSTSSYASSVIYGAYSGGSVGLTAGSLSSFNESGSVSTNGVSMNVELGDPFNSKFTSYRSLHAVMNNAGSAIAISGVHHLANSYTGFTITTSSGTISGGTIYVYGYGTS